MTRWMPLFLLIALAVAGCAKAPPAAELEPSPPNYAPTAKAAWPASLSPEPVEIVKAEALRAERVGKLDSDDPYDAAWKKAPYVEVPVFAQNIAMPKLDAATIPSVRVQALTDGERIAWRVSWADASPDGNVDAARFTDSVAIQFPIDAGAAPMMGHRDTGRVQILHWKALWQKDIDVGFQDVEDLHPNMWSDLYWFAEGSFPFSVPGAFNDPRSHTWFIAHQAGNPMAVFSRTQPVEELVAEGWGTLTAQQETVSQGRGVWVNGRWAVVFSRPMKSADPLDRAFAPGDKAQVAFAVWNGGEGQVGGRKHWSNWTVFEVAP